MLTEDFILSALTTIKTRYMHLYIHHSTVTIPKAWKQPKCLSTDEWIKKIWYIYTMQYYSAIKMKQHKCPSTDEWIKKIWYIYTMEYYSAIKKNEIMPFAATWMDPEIIILSEVRQWKTNIIWYYLHVESKKKGTNELICRTETDSQNLKHLWLLKGTGGRGWDGLGV